jgi:hypothetical protein
MREALLHKVFVMNFGILNNQRFPRKTFQRDGRKAREGNQHQDTDGCECACFGSGYDGLGLTENRVGNRRKNPGN